MWVLPDQKEKIDYHQTKIWVLARQYQNVSIGQTVYWPDQFGYWPDQLDKIVGYCETKQTQMWVLAGLIGPK